MSNRKGKRLCLLLMALCVIQALSYGQRQDTVSGDKLIINGSDFAIYFQLKNRGSAWKEFSLGPNKQCTYSSATDIRISTENGCKKEYTLVHGNRYKVYWDDNERCWDVIMLTPGR